MKIKTTSIINEATEIKTFIEKNKKLPKYCTIEGNQYSPYTVAYLISRTIANLKADSFNVKTISKSNQGFSVKLNESCSKTTYLDMIQRFNEYCSKNKRIPAYVITIKNKADFTTFLYSMCKILTYYKNHKVLPNSCLFTSSYIDVSQKSTAKTKNNNNQSTSTSKKTNNCVNPYTSKPHLTTTKEGLGQNYPWDCSANAVSQCLYKLSGKNISEGTLVKIGGVTTSGCGHDGINTMVAWFNKKYGTNYKVTWKNFSDLGKDRDSRFLALAKLLCKSNTAVLCHIGYANSGKEPITRNSKIFGHYEVLDKVNVKTKYVRALNSLGKKINANAYAGHLQDRTYETQASFFANTPGGQPALMIVTKK